MNRRELAAGCFLALLLLFLYGLPAQAREQGLILYYNFENPDSVVVEDASGNGNDAIIRNYKKSGFEIRTEVIQGVRVQALSLPGGADGAYLELPDDILDQETQITVCAWVKLHSNTWYQRIWDFGNGQKSYLYLLSNGNNEGFKGYATAITNQGWTMEQGVQKGTNFERNEWVFTTVTIREREITLYENGEVIGKTRADVALSDLGGTRNNYFGKGQFRDNPMNGELAEVAIYNYAMETREVQGLFKGLKEDQILPESTDADPDRLLYSYRQNYGVDTGGARPLGGLENPGGLLKGTAVGECLSHLATVYGNTSDKEVREKAAYLVQELWKLQKLSESQGWGAGYLAATDTGAFDRLEKGEGYPQTGAPYAAMGSLMKGLLDTASAMELVEAQEIAEALAEWCIQRSNGYTRSQKNSLWNQEVSGETCGLGGALARLYGLTGEAKYLDAARRFVYPRWFEILKSGEDGLSLLSVSAGISQADTLLEIYRADSGAIDEKKAAESFWELATENYSYVTGVLGVDGRFRIRSQAVEEYPAQNTENRKICLNMLELTWKLHQINPQEPKYLDYYERLLNNQNLGEAGEATAGPTRIFEEKEGNLQVNLYIPGETVFKKSGTRIRMQTGTFGEEATLSVERVKTADDCLTVRLRIPSWCRETMEVRRNGRRISGEAGADGYLTLTELKEGDQIEIRLPFSCYLEESFEEEAAVMLGPYVMVNEDSYGEQTLVLTKKVTDMVEREPTAMPSLQINGRKFLPYVYSVYSDRKLYHRILYTENPKQRWYRIRIEESDMTGGTVKADSELVFEGDSVTIFAKAREGYMLDYLLVNGKKVELQEGETYRVSDITENLTISGSFSEKNPLTPRSDSLEQTAQVSAHYTAPWENLEGVKDASFHPASSNEGMGKGWGDWQQKEGAKCWIAYTWQKPVTLDTCEIYWYDDEGATGMPESFYLEYQDEKGEWKKAVMHTEMEDALKKDQYNQIDLEPVTTQKLRLVMIVAKEKRAVGIYRWKVSG